MAKFLWYTLTSKETLSALKSSEKGLSEKEAKERLKKYGKNELPKKAKLSAFVVLFNQFKSPLIYILVIAAIVSYGFQEYIDGTVILIAVFLNTIVGFVQEYKAETALDKLRSIISFSLTALRDGHKKVIDASELVPGDIVYLEAGDRVPADGRILELNDFHVNEASLTGESMPVTKSLDVLKKGTGLGDRTNMVFMGTSVTRGRATIVITQTGIQTEVGQIAQLVKETKEGLTPLQAKLEVFSKKIGWLVLVISSAIFILGVLSKEDPVKMFETAVAIAVSAIPEGLIIGMTIILTVGMQRILKQHALVKRLVAAETLGSTSVICTDKTGTLTEGRMEVTTLLTGVCDLKRDSIDFSKNKLVKTEGHLLALRIGFLCNNAIIGRDIKKDSIGSPTELALKFAGTHVGFSDEKMKSEYPRMGEIPFSGEMKYMVTLHRVNKSTNALYIKGAPERILEFVTGVYIDGEIKKIDAKLKEEIVHNIAQLTKGGLRVLAVGYKEVPSNRKDIDAEKLDDFVFVGVFGIKDPLRKEAKRTIKLAQKAGLNPVIITGDHKLTVKAIAKEIGFLASDDEILEGIDLDDMSNAQLRDRVRNIKIYARVSPKHKLRIVNAWQSHGEVVAMIGDGVNDAPALKLADIGVALGSGTDVAKGTSDIILLNDNFRTIVLAIKQGRVIFDNIRKIIVYLLADSFTEVILIGGALLVGFPLPITALQILYVNIVNDGPPNIALAFEPEESDIMRQKPRKKNEPILNSEMKVLIFIIGIFTDLVLFGLYFYLRSLGWELDLIRTVIFAALAVDSLFYVFSVKSLRQPIWKINLLSNKYLIWSVIIGFGLLVLAIYVPFIQHPLELRPLRFENWLLLFGLGIFNIIMIEIGKAFFIHKKKTK